jgi:surfeit locus 1 family protein
VSRPRAAIVVSAAALACAGFLALGIWQLERRGWKSDLIARVEQRVHAPPGAAPGPGDWPSFHARDEEYRHVLVSGRYLANRDVLVHASTVLGAGYWVMSPLQTPQGATYLVNRGFVESGGQVPSPPDSQLVTGLLRLSEPRGALLRDNDPASDRWYSRDVAAMASARGLAQVAPFFIDADAPADAPAAGAASPRDAKAPIPGLTVVHFPNNHLSYALTWFALALMSAWAFTRVLGDRSRGA